MKNLISFSLHPRNQTKIFMYQFRRKTKGRDKILAESNTLQKFYANPIYQNDKYKNEDYFICKVKRVLKEKRHDKTEVIPSSIMPFWSLMDVYLDI